jgi:hypothetical protein
MKRRALPISNADVRDADLGRRAPFFYFWRFT